MQNSKHSNVVKIAGAGIAGLTAAINLKRSGKHVIVFEKESAVGKSRHGDYEGLENWIFNGTMNEYFMNIGFDFNSISATPIYKINVHTQLTDPLLVQSKTPFFYMVRRGNEDDCIDAQLYNQCCNENIEFKFHTKPPECIQINATGSMKAVAYIQGINFETKMKNQVHLLLGNNYAPLGYAYLIILNGRGTLATAYKQKNGITNTALKLTKEYFLSRGFSFYRERLFGGRGSFIFTKNNGFNVPLFIGEAGGYQDYLFGFGMRMAMMSGKIAASYLSGELKEAKKWVKNLNRKCNVSFLNRMVYEKLTDHQKFELGKRLSDSPLPVDLLSRAYKWNFKNMMRLKIYESSHENSFI